MFCGMLAPLVLLFILAATFANGFAASVKANKGLVRVATMLAHWAMPEVLALGVLVAVFKVRDLVNVRYCANCPCGTTMALSSEGMPLAQLWPLLAWARVETKRRGLSPQELLNYLRAEICKQVLAAPP